MLESASTLQRGDEAPASADMICPGDRAIFGAFAGRGNLEQAKSLLPAETFRLLSVERESALAKPPAPRVTPKKRAPKKPAGKLRAGKNHSDDGSLPSNEEPPVKTLRALKPPPKYVLPSSPRRAQRPVSPPRTPVTKLKPASPGAQAHTPVFKLKPAAPKPIVQPVVRSSYHSEVGLAPEVSSFLQTLLALPLPPLLERLRIDPRHAKLSELAGTFTTDGKTNAAVQLLLAEASGALATRHDTALAPLAGIFHRLKDTLGSADPTRQILEKFFALVVSGELRGHMQFRPPS